MNLEELRTRLRRKIGDETGIASTQITDAVLNEKINDAVDFIIDRYRFQNNRNLCSFSTVIGTESYTLPTAYQHLLRVWDTTNQVRLVQRDDNWLADNQATTQGKPTDYVHHKTWIKLRPVPDGVYAIQVRHKAAIDALSDDSDEPVIPSSWHPGIVLYARYLFWDEQASVQKAEYALDIWDRWVENKPVEVDEELMWDNEEGLIVPSLSGRRGPRLDWDSQA